MFYGLQGAVSIEFRISAPVLIGPGVRNGMQCKTRSRLLGTYVYRQIVVVQRDTLIDGGTNKGVLRMRIDGCGGGATRDFRGPAGSSDPLPRLGQMEFEEEAGALADVRLDMQLGVHVAHQALHDRKPQSARRKEVP